MTRRLIARLCRRACETERKLNGPAAAFRLRRCGSGGQVAAARLRRARKAGHRVLSAVSAILAVMLLLGTSRLASAQRQSPPTTAGETRAPETQGTPERPAAGETRASGEVVEGAAGAEHEEGLLPVIARFVNFAILVGTLVYLLRSPLMAYLNDRGTQIRSDLVNAAEMKRAAAAQLDEIDRRMKALPGELEALRGQGAQEIAAEEARIRAAASAERDRLLDQARRDIDQHVKVAERELVNHAADLAVAVAAERIRKTITDDDQKRLADRYVQQLKGAAGRQP
jgi:F-type H+-transporting ATPase subunit b